MNRKYSALALSAVAMGAVVLTTTEASATKDPGGGSTSQAVPNSSPGWPDEGMRLPANRRQGR